MKRHYESNLEEATIMEETVEMDEDGSSPIAAGHTEHPNDFMVDSDWTGFMQEREPGDRQRAIGELHQIYRAQSTENGWLYMNKIMKAGLLKGLVSRSIGDTLSLTDVKIALNNFESPASSSKDKMDIESDQTDSSSSKVDTMPDLMMVASNRRPKESLLQSISDVERNKDLAPFLTLVQSSGYGKTKTMLEVAKTRRVVYLLCSNINGGWTPPKVVNDFVTEIKSGKTDTERRGIASQFLQAVAATAGEYSKPQKLYDAQFTSEGAFSKFYNDLDKNFRMIKLLRGQTQGVTPANATDREVPSALVVVFDESKILAMEDSQTVKSAYRCLRAELRRESAIGVFLDTFGSTSLFLPEDAPSDRETGIGFFPPPVFEIDTFDEFKDHFLFLGRPLWKMNWQYRHDQDFTELVKFAAHKLCPANIASPKDGYVALFLCRYGLNPSGELAKRLVASHLATLVGVSVDRKQLLTKYKSEPILAEASAYLTTCGSVNLHENVLLEVRSLIGNKVLTSAKGDRGEIAAAAWFGYTLDRLRQKTTSCDKYNAERTSLSREIDVLQFIEALCSSTTIMDDTVRQLLKGWMINVTHFSRLGYSPGRDILPLAWKRRVGLYMPEGEEGVDIVIPACIDQSKEKFATVRVQVKNYKNIIGKTCMYNLFQKLEVRTCAPLSTFEEEPLSIAFLVQVGQGQMAARVGLQDLGKKTRASTPLAQQVQVACSLSDESDRDLCASLRDIAGAGVENTEFVLSSEHFNRGELVVPD